MVFSTFEPLHAIPANALWTWQPEQAGRSRSGQTPFGSTRWLGCFGGCRTSKACLGYRSRLTTTLEERGGARRGRVAVGPLHPTAVSVGRGMTASDRSKPGSARVAESGTLKPKWSNHEMASLACLHSCMHFQGPFAMDVPARDKRALPIRME